ncbi:protein hook [Stomoxys calcitrans]|uniref:protein hook n=1 Tax=Stomoxys calcitrans TaxID=35570 RepID=UPI0027E3783A|nr:protein hook [Stomoxys calcitrans]
MGDMCQSLIDWFQTLKLAAPHSNAEELSDGVALAQALHQFSPESFTDVWLSKIKGDVGMNWRLKMSNLKKVVEALYDYYTDVLNYSLAEFPRPDAMRIAEKHDAVELERLLQLILGCAVNCATKQDYIRDIMLLEESLQANIMKALQELESSCQGASMSRNPLSIVNFDSKILQEERDRLAQKCFDLEKKNALLVEEKANLSTEVTKLQEDIRKLETASTIGDDGISLGPVMAGSTRYLDMRKQLDELKEELLQSETSREDLRLKSQQQDTEIQLLQQRVEELNKTATEFLKLKDEIDVLREANEKLKVCEAQVKTYKKKLEDYTDLKKQLKLLDERSAEYLQQNVQFEEDAKKCAALRGQIELYKKEVQDLHVKLDKEMSNNLKLEFESKTMEETIFSLQQAKDGLLKERDGLREALDELKCGQMSNSSEDVATAMSKELQPSAISERVKRLELENKALREGQGGQTALMQLLDDANKRNTNLREQLKAATERIMSLTHVAATSEDGNAKGTDISKQMKHLLELNEQKAVQLDEYINQNTALQSKITQLETTLATRDQELLGLDTKYRKCVERAKDIIKNMDPRGINASDANLLENMQEIADYKKQEFSSLEENLMATAFYRLGANSQRDIIDSKLALLLGQGQTFLSRQRQSGPRKVMATVKGK